MPKHVPHFAARFDRLANVAALNLESALNTGEPFFTLDLGDALWATYLGQFTAEDRQYHDCHCCRDFLRKYGSLVTIDPKTLELSSVLWRNLNIGPYGEPLNGVYYAIAKAIRLFVETQTGPVRRFFWSESDWGKRYEGGFSHFSAKVKPNHASRTQTAGGAMAEAQQRASHLARALGELKPEHLTRAMHLGKLGRIERGDKVAPMAEWLLNVQGQLAELRTPVKSRNVRRGRLLALAEAVAPAGWTTPRSSVLGALVEDMESGLSDDQVIKRHGGRVDPMKYQRPTTVSEGNIARAEAMIASMNLEQSLRRRVATLDEVPCLWKPTHAARVESGGVFGHLRGHSRETAERSTLNARPIPISFAKFRRDVLPLATKMEMMLPYRGSYCGFLTAGNADAPPIIQWDRPEARNPLSWYLYNGGSGPSDWGLLRVSKAEVLGVAAKPCAETMPESALSVGALFVLAGARDMRGASANLFPELLRGDLREVRSTIEAHGQKTKAEACLLDSTAQHASGYLVGAGDAVEVLVRTLGGVGRYSIDRWE
jgi:hypothetical protein